MIREIVFHRRARRELVAASRWWSRHRDKAPDAFDEDLRETWQLIEHSPHIGQAIRAKRPGVRRVLMERVRYYVYYYVRDEIIEVISVWHASRRPPRL